MNQATEKRESDRIFKRLSTKLELAMRHITVGLNIVDKIDAAETDADRELYALMARHSLSDSWNTLTKILRQIAQDIDHDTPKGPGAAQALVDRMTQRTNGRNSILSLKHAHTISRISKLHRDVRQSKLSQHATSEVIELLEAISDDIVPDIMDNLRVLALASPGGSKLINHLRPKSGDAAEHQFDVERKVS
jgi:hypothetical protein